jgi:hypothetical protein
MMRYLKTFTVLIALGSLLAACGGGGNGTVAVDNNTVPTADAGADQNVSTGTLVTLDGSGSLDADGDLIDYQWTLIHKPEASTASLLDAITVAPSFTADVDGIYVASLVVSDASKESTPAIVAVTAATGNSVPVADAGPDIDVYTGNLVSLDGGNSSDADTDALSYNWEFIYQPGGSTALLVDAITATPDFTPDLDGIYVISLFVNDGTVDSVVDTMIVSSTTLNLAPVANAGVDQEVPIKALVTLDGSGSSDANSDPLNYSWVFTSKPGGSSAVLTNPATETPTFVPDRVGSYVLNLTTNDGSLDSSPDPVIVTVRGYVIELLQGPTDTDEQWVDFGSFPSFTFGTDWALAEKFLIPTGADTFAYQLFRGSAFQDLPGDFSIDVDPNATAQISHTFLPMTMDAGQNGVTLTEGEWHTIIIQYELATEMASLYVDGILMDSGTVAASYFDDRTNGNPLYWGGQWLDPDYVPLQTYNLGQMYNESDTTIAHMAMWQRLLSSAEIASYNGQVDLSDSSLVLATQIEESTVIDVVADKPITVGGSPTFYLP